VNDDFLSRFSWHFAEMKLAEGDFTRLLAECIKTLNNFPSISEAMIVIAGFGLGPNISKVSKPEEFFEFTPKVTGYTAAHEGLFMGFEQRGSPSPFGMKYCSIDAGEFLEVYHEWKNGRVHPAANRKMKPEILTRGECES